MSQLKVNSTGHGASYVPVNSLFIYPGVNCYVGVRWVIWVTLELAQQRQSGLKSGVVDPGKNNLIF